MALRLMYGAYIPLEIQLLATEKTMMNGEYIDTDLQFTYGN